MAAAAVPTIPLAWTPGPTVAIPRMLLGTGGGDRGYDVAAWLAAGGPGMDSAYTYCYNTAAPYCSHVAIDNAVRGRASYVRTVSACASGPAA